MNKKNTEKARRKLVVESTPAKDQDIVSYVAQYVLKRDTNKVYLAQRGMRVYNKELLAKKCYICKHTGSLENQLIPRWISKETMVCICAGCYERTNGWVKDEPVKTWAWWENSKEAQTLMSAVSAVSEWKKENGQNAKE